MTVSPERAWRFLIDEVVDFVCGRLLSLHYSNRKVDQKLIGRAKQSRYALDERLRIPAETIESHLGQVNDRMNQIEAKAKEVFVSISLALGLLTVLIALAVGSNAHGTAGSSYNIASVPLMISLFYFIVSALCAKQVFGVTPRYVTVLRDRPETRSEGANDDREWRVSLLYSIDCNELVGVRKTNFFYVSSHCFTLGLFCVFAFAVLMAISMWFNVPDTTSNSGVERYSQQVCVRE